MSDTPPSSTPGTSFENPPVPASSSRRIASGLAAILSLVMFMAIGADVLYHGTLYRCDARIALRIYATMSPRPAAVNLCAAVCQMGALPFTVAVGVVTAGLLVYFQRWRFLAMWVVGLAASAWLGTLVQSHFAEERPMWLTQFPLAEGFSFPSTQVMAAVLTFGLLAHFLLRIRPARGPAWVLLGAAGMFAVAASLLLVGACYTTDILGGLTLGWGLLFGVIALLG